MCAPQCRLLRCSVVGCRPLTSAPLRPPTTPTGLTYDGTLSECGLWFDSGSATDLQTVILDGGFELAADVTEAQLGPAYLVPAPTLGRSTPGLNAVCHDTVTGVK